MGQAPWHTGPQPSLPTAGQRRADMRCRKRRRISRSDGWCSATDTCIRAYEVSTTSRSAVQEQAQHCQACCAGMLCKMSALEAAWQVPRVHLGHGQAMHLVHGVWSSSCPCHGGTDYNSRCRATIFEGDLQMPRIVRNMQIFGANATTAVFDRTMLPNTRARSSRHNFARAEAEEGLFDR